MDVLAKAITELREEHQHVCEAILALGWPLYGMERPSGLRRRVHRSGHGAAVRVEPRTWLTVLAVNGFRQAIRCRATPRAHQRHFSQGA